MFSRICCPAINSYATSLWTILSPASIFLNIAKLFFFYFVLKGVREFYFDDYDRKREIEERRIDRSRAFDASPYGVESDSHVKIYVAPIARLAEDSHGHRS